MTLRLTETSLSLKTPYESSASSSSSPSSSSSTSPVKQATHDSRGPKSSSQPLLSLHQASRRRVTAKTSTSSSSETITFSLDRKKESSSGPSSLTDSNTSYLFGLLSEMFAIPNFLSSFAQSSSLEGKRMHHKTSSMNSHQILCVSLAILVTLNFFCVPVVEGQRIVISGKAIRVAIARMHRRLSAFRRFIMPIEVPLLRPPQAPLEAINRVVRMVANRPRPISAPLLTSSPSRLAMVLIPERWRPLPRPFF